MQTPSNASLVSGQILMSVHRLTQTTVPKSGYTCSCATGFLLDSDERGCSGKIILLSRGLTSCLVVAVHTCIYLLGVVLTLHKECRFYLEYSVQ